MARVLIVDDSVVARKNLHQILTELGHAVVGEAENGAQAFLQYGRLKPNIATMDVSMPGMSGGDTVAKILASYPDAKIIVVSALSDRQVIIDALGKGARHFLIKPIAAEKLAEVIGIVLSQKFSRDQHTQMVNKLREKYTSESKNLEKAIEVNPPFKLEERDGVVLVSIFPHITISNVEVLTHELEQFLIQPEPKMIINFADTEKLSLELLMEIEKLIKTVESQRGRVKAICNNKQFFALISEAEYAGQLPFLSSTLKCFAK